MLIQDHKVVSAFVKFGNVKLESKELLLRILRKTFSRPFRKRLLNSFKVAGQSQN